MKLLVDTNVLISAVICDRLPDRVIKHIATQDDWLWMATPDIDAEYRRVLNRPRFRLAADVVDEWLRFLEGCIIPATIGDVEIEFPRDPKDSMFLAAANATDADFLITGDKDFQDARRLIATRIVTVAEFAKLFNIA